MDPAEALADLKQISTQIERAVIARRDGSVEAATVAGDVAERIGRAACELFAAADRAGSDLGRPALAQVEVATQDGSVFAVRDPGRMLVATTPVDPTVGLIFYDLKTCLRAVAEHPAEVAAGKGDDDGGT